MAEVLSEETGRQFVFHPSGCDKVVILSWLRPDQVTQVCDDQGAGEDRCYLRRTIVVGDLNMNPFDAGDCDARALNAVMTKNLARKDERIVEGTSQRLFYNPMWGLLGDRTDGPPGSSFLNSSRPLNDFRNMPDQVRILDHDGDMSLTTRNGRPRGIDLSDHLPRRDYSAMAESLRRVLGSAGTA